MNDNQIHRFIASQLESWELAAANYAGLRKSLVREIPMDGYNFYVQYNPERIRSSAAKVDPRSISERPCFLCTKNLPVQQEQIPYLQEYTILVNPYPIFREHLTIPSVRHTDQLISGRMGDMLHLAKDLQDFILFYNGPRCGASAPDHFHFQAGNKGMLPIEKDLSSFSGKKVVLRREEGIIYEMENYLRKTLVLESVNFEWLINEFESLLLLFKKVQDPENEAMMNILTLHNGTSWNIILFPRTKHRPEEFFEEGDKQILFSPASVDFGGLLITPREEDFHKLNKETVTGMFSQLTIPDAMWNSLIRDIQDNSFQ